jgi:hypothetical protein
MLQATYHRLDNDPATRTALKSNHIQHSVVARCAALPKSSGGVTPAMTITTFLMNCAWITPNEWGDQVCRETDAERAEDHLRHGGVILVRSFVTLLVGYLRNRAAATVRPDSGAGQPTPPGLCLGVSGAAAAEPMRTSLPCIRGASLGRNLRAECGKRARWGLRLREAGSRGRCLREYRCNCSYRWLPSSAGVAAESQRPSIWER